VSVSEKSIPPMQGTQKGAATQLCIAPFMVLRVAGLPTSFPSRLPGDKVSEVAASRRGVLSRLEHLAERVVEQLFEVIAHPHAEVHTRALLKAKREAYGRRALDLGAAGTWLMRAMPDVYALCEEYHALQRSSEVLWGKLCIAVEEDHAATVALVREALQIEDFCNALGLAVPRIFSQLDAESTSRKAKRRLQADRTLFAYVMRASTKISPFSYFASSCLAPLDLTRPQGTLSDDGWTVQAESHLNRSIVVALREAFFGARSMAENDLPIMLNPSLCFDISEGAVPAQTDALKASGYLRTYRQRRGSLWSEETLLNTTLPATLCTVLKALPPSLAWSALIERLWEVEPETAKATRLARQLMRKDILRPAIQWGAHCIRPGQYLADSMDMVHSPSRLAQHIRALDEQAKAFSRVPGRLRGSAMAALDADFRRLYADLTPQRPPELVTALYEDTWGEGLTARFGSAFAQQTLQRIAQVIGSRSSLSTDYLWLRQRFLQLHGEGGRCEDVASFLANAWAPYLAYLQSAVNGTGPMEFTHKGILPAVLRLPLTVYFQIVSNDPDEALNGQPQIVINAAYSRLGWQLSRSTALAIAHGAARTEQISRWLAEAAGASAPLTLSVSGESSNLQVHQRMAAHHLCLDEQPSQPGDLMLSDLHLVHDPDTGLIGLTAPDGKPFSLQYLGGASPMPAWGFKHLLIALAEPMQVGRPDVQTVVASPQDDDFRHQPRIEEQGCVLVRETWWLRSRLLLERVDGLDVSGQVDAVLALCNASGIPEAVYVNGQFDDYFSWRSFASAKTRKPVWSKLSNAFCVNALIALAQAADWLVFHEALPAPDDSWLRVDGVPVVSELHAEMVLVGGSPSERWTL
jgi:hypothetical protein